MPEGGGLWKATESVGIYGLPEEVDGSLGSDPSHCHLKSKLSEGQALHSAFVRIHGAAY